MFVRFLSSPVIVNEYLPTLIPMGIMSECLAEEWVLKTCPQQLMQSATHNPSLRIGAARLVFSLVEALTVRDQLMYFNVFLQWAETSVDVMEAILSKADEMVTGQTIDLVPKLRALLLKAAKSPSPDLRLKIPNILGTNPTVFLERAPDLAFLVDLFAADTRPELRLAFLDNFLMVFARTSAQAAQDSLYRLFTSCFDNPGPDVRSRLCKSIVYSIFGPAKLSQLLGIFVRFMGTLQTWRNLAECVQTFLSFSPEVVLVGWQAVYPVLFAGVFTSPYAMAASCRHFCAKMVTLLPPPDLAVFGDEVVKAFATHENFAVRALLADCAGALCVPQLLEEVVDAIFAAFTALSNDPVLAVRASIITALVRPRMYYAMASNPREREVIALFLTYGKSTEPTMQAKWAQASKVFNVPVKKPEPPATQSPSVGPAPDTSHKPGVPTSSASAGAGLLASRWLPAAAVHKIRAQRQVLAVHPRSPGPRPPAGKRKPDGLPNLTRK
jgi:hypothetical protein